MDRILYGFKIFHSCLTSGVNNDKILVVHRSFGSGSISSEKFFFNDFFHLKGLVMNIITKKTEKSLPFTTSANSLTVRGIKGKYKKLHIQLV